MRKLGPKEILAAKIYALKNIGQTKLRVCFIFRLLDKLT